MDTTAEETQIIARFFGVLELLKEKRIIRGVNTFTERYGINRRNLYKLKQEPSRKLFDTIWLKHLVTDYDVSAMWLLTGEGDIFIEENGLNKKIVLHDGKEFFAKAIIIATGGKLGGSQFKYDKYLNKGLSYCAVCDGNFYKEKSVAVIGNNDSVENTVDYLSNIAANIYFINIEDKESTSKNVENFTNIDEYAIGGENRVEYVKIGDKTINVDGVFYDLESNSFSGFSSKLETQNGYIKVDTNQQTSIEGIFAAGDIVNGSVKQVIVASSQGAIAALSAIKYINKNKKDA